MIKKYYNDIRDVILTETQIRTENPNVSFSVPFEPGFLGFSQIEETTKPVINFLQVIEDGGIVYDVDVWKQVWNIVDKYDTTTEEEEAFNTEKINKINLNRNNCTIFIYNHYPVGIQLSAIDLRYGEAFVLAMRQHIDSIIEEENRVAVLIEAIEYPDIEDLLNVETPAFPEE